MIIQILNGFDKNIVADLSVIFNIYTALFEVDFTRRAINAVDGAFYSVAAVFAVHAIHDESCLSNNRVIELFVGNFYYRACSAASALAFKVLD